MEAAARDFNQNDLEYLHEPHPSFNGSNEMPPPPSFNGPDEMPPAYSDPDDFNFPP